RRRPARRNALLIADGDRVSRSREPGNRRGPGRAGRFGSSLPFRVWQVWQGLAGGSWSDQGASVIEDQRAAASRDFFLVFRVFRVFWCVGGPRESAGL